MHSQQKEAPMPFPTKVQLIKRKNSEQWYINFPSAVAQMMDFTKGEVVQWSLHDRRTLLLDRPEAPPSPLKKTKRRSSKASKRS
jgi:hypothetical protein